ncbi:hypothetical protein [Mycobacterium sp. E3339]|uniref:hypothetical protein n=1 Tax=Mycobacterium sp. E3339 TaxID=1834146 RepID=UPI0007FDC767|nr:hypothetical protein A5702_07235 [Mycobacterium sp. E3339]
MTLLDILPSVKHAAPPRPAGAPADETDFRDRARHWRKTLRNARVVYFGRSPLTTGLARVATEEGLGIGVRSDGELAVALAAGTDPARIVAHPGSPGLFRDAVGVGVGRIVLEEPLAAPHVAGRARRGSAHNTFEPVGLHCRPDPSTTRADAPVRYGEAIRRTIAAMADVRARRGVILTELHVGGDQAGPYVVGGWEPSAGELAALIEDTLDEACAAEHFPRPVVALGVTLTS